MVNLSGILERRHTTVIGSVVDEIMAGQGIKKAFELMPIKNTFAQYIEHEVIHAYGGLTNERALGEEGKSIAGLSTSVKVMMPGSYQEHIPFYEKDLLALRKAGTYGERGLTGMTNDELNMINRSAQKLKLRIENRIQKLIWDAIFTKKFVYKGTEFAFDVPAANDLTATTDWSDVVNSDPFGDLQKLIDQDPILRKYKWKEIIVNGTTESYMMQSNKVQSYVTNANVANLSNEELRKFIQPGLPQITCVKDSYQEESIVDGKVVAGNAEFFVPDDKVLLVPDFSGSDYQQYGDFELTENLNDPAATLDRPAVGTYVFADEEGLRNKKSPHIEVIGGFNGAPNLKRPQDVFVVSV